MSSLRNPAGGQQGLPLQQQTQQQQHLQFLQQQQQLLQHQQFLLQQQQRLQQQQPLQYCHVPQQQVLLPQYLHQQQHHGVVHQQQQPTSSHALQHTRQLVTHAAYNTPAAPVGLPPAHMPVVCGGSAAAAGATGAVAFPAPSTGSQLLQQPMAGRMSSRLRLVTAAGVPPQQAEQLQQPDLLRRQQVLHPQHAFPQQQVLLQQQHHHALQHPQLLQQQQQLLQQHMSRLPYGAPAGEAPLQHTPAQQPLLQQQQQPRQPHTSQPGHRIALRIGPSAAAAAAAAAGGTAAAAEAHSTSEEEDDHSSSGSSSSNSEEDDEGTRKKARRTAAARAGTRDHHHGRVSSRRHSSGASISRSESRTGSAAAGDSGRSGSSKGDKKKSGEHPHAKARRTADGKKHRERRSSCATALKQRKKAAKLYLKAVQYLTKATYILEDEGAVQHVDSDSKSSKRLAKLLIRYDRVLGKLENYMSSNASLSGASVPVGLVHALDNNVDPNEWIRKCVLDVHRQKSQELRGVFAAFGVRTAAVILSTTGSTGLNVEKAPYAANQV